jgi:hypothetical protein
MAFAERTGPTAWCVRYWTDAGVHGSIAGFATESGAKAKARRRIAIADSRRQPKQCSGGRHIVVSRISDHLRGLSRTRRKTRGSHSVTSTT